MSLVDLDERSSKVQTENTGDIVKEDSNQLSHSPINKLPQELLSLIFLACYNSDMERNLNLSLVCKLWQNIVISDPRLWSNIIIRCKRDLTNLRFLWRQAEIHLSRSKQLPLDIQIDLRRLLGYPDYMYQRPKVPLSPGEYDDLTADTIRRLLGNNMEHVYRWRSFNLKCSQNMNAYAVVKVWKILEGQYDALVDLLIYIQHLPPLPRFFVPTFDCCATKQPIDPGKILINPSKMTSISLFSHQIAFEFLRMAATTTFSALSTLEIAITIKEGISDAPLRLPRLTTLGLFSSLSGVVIPPLLDAPHLTDVTFVWRQDTDEKLLPPSIFAQLKALDFRLTGDWTPERAYKIIRGPLQVALSSATLLETLKITAGSKLRREPIELVRKLRARGYPLSTLKELTLVTTAEVDGKTHEKFYVFDVAAK
ncbi:hypothetical protein M408DRAFT_145073 [Serendipita vermifera MAFF 305830]|uniref:F-box domain-containing protein n=1 Tax=Serendipita vermifera MAFF 305830 TaxID=933852 RepID=A0A0C3B807_SERVB|nr:hypothetical protein M408DRAFT_145073 [Serendipita vermifera MAFF 305830]